MERWTGIALALRTPADDRMASRLPTVLHPLAGRPLAWHVLQAIASARPPPRRILFCSAPGVELPGLAAIPADAVVAGPGGNWWRAVAARLGDDEGPFLVADAAAAALLASLHALVTGPPGRALRAPGGEALAVWVADREALACAGAGGLEALAAACETVPAADPAEAFVVRDRAGLARAGALIQRRLIRRLMDGGVTFLQPESVLVDVDVEIGADTVIYPGVVLEGRTTIGSETVIGPGCRIIDSQVGNGVELKGWNYLSGTTIRNRAVLEPYVRRGFD
ncbi:MAG TPA: hypothetical protein VF192_15105 [Longimicrobiales bacterium]